MQRGPRKDAELAQRHPGGRHREDEEQRRPPAASHGTGWAGGATDIAKAIRPAYEPPAQHMHASSGTK